MIQSDPEIRSVLVVGCGYLGKPAAQRWLNQSASVFAVTRSPETAASFHDAGFTPLQLDLASPKPTIDLPDVDAVLWAVGFDRTAGMPRKAVWIDGLKWLLQNLKPSLKRFLYVSSTGVYGDVDQEVVTEDSAARPVTEAGLCCLEAEQIVRAHFEDSHQANSEQANARTASATVLRMAGIYGPDRLLRKVTDLKQQTPLVGDPQHWLNLIHVDDAVSAIHFAATQADFPAVVNVANSETMVRQDYYQKLADLVNAPPPVFGSQAATGRARSGNKRVTSRYHFHQLAGFRFDAVADGLLDAFERSQLI